MNHRKWAQGLTVAGLAVVALGGGSVWAGMHRAQVVFSPTLHVVTQAVPTLPSFYHAMTLTANAAISTKAPWTVIESAVTTGRVLRRFPLASKTRPRIVYATPAGLAILVTHPGPTELFVGTQGPAAPVTVWRRPPSAIPPLTINSWGSHTLLWEVSAGPAGGALASGAFDTQSLKSLAANRSMLHGSWYTDVNQGVVYRVLGHSLALWNGRRWVSRGQAPVGRIVAVSTHGWYLADQPSQNGTVTIEWANADSPARVNMRVQGTLEVGGADWALVLRGTTLVCVIPSRHRQYVVAQGVVSPVTANNAVYWISTSGQALRAYVSSSAVSAVANIMW